MVDLFEGAPEEWLQAVDDTAHQYLTKPVIDWLHAQTIKAQAQRAQDEMARRQEDEALMARHADPTRGTVGGEPMAWDTRRAVTQASERNANFQDAKAAEIAARRAEDEALMARHYDPSRPDTQPGGTPMAWDTAMAASHPRMQYQHQSEEDRLAQNARVMQGLHDAGQQVASYFHAGGQGLADSPDNQ